MVFTGISLILSFVFFLLVLCLCSCQWESEGTEYSEVKPIIIFFVCAGGSLVVLLALSMYTAGLGHL